MDEKDSKELLPLAVMAKRLRVPSKWLRERAAAGEIPALRAGNRWLFRPDVVGPKVAEMATYSTKVAGHQTFKDGKLVDVVEGGAS